MTGKHSHSPAGDSSLMAACKTSLRLHMTVDWPPHKIQPWDRPTIFDKLKQLAGCHMRCTIMHNPILSGYDTSDVTDGSSVQTCICSSVNWFFFPGSLTSCASVLQR